MKGQTWLERALDILLPRTCAGCREDLPPPLSGPLCGGCLRGLRPLREQTRPRGLVWNDSAAAAYAYGGPLPRLVHACKYGGRPTVGRALGDWMAGLWPRHAALHDADGLVAVPLHPARLRERGFNQARLLAEAVARATRLPLLDALERARRTPPQARRRREERGEGLRDAFRARAAEAAGKRLVLIDDVFTTGATVEACARALVYAGAEGVRTYALARADMPGEAATPAPELIPNPVARRNWG